MGEPPERSKELLNRETPNVTGCAWPNCRKPMNMPLPGGGSALNRYGVLCAHHAVEVAVAVLQDQVSLNHFQQVLAQQDSARMARGIEAQRIDAQYEADLAARKQGRDGFVYYIEIDERIKIGFSRDVKRRMRAYPPASKLLAVEPGDPDIEKQRHKQFAGSLAYGREWFTPTTDLREHIEQVLADHGEPPRRMAHHYTAKRQPMRVRRRD